MRLADLAAADITRQLGGQGLVLVIGPFTFRLKSPIDSVQHGLVRLYGDYKLLDQEQFADFEVVVVPVGGWRRWWRPQAVFRFDGVEPFLPLPLTHAYPLMEWAMNWCVSMHVQHYLLLHAAVVEKHGLALLLPAPPGSGKSTLCAGLIHRGWRLLSDEMALISLDGHLVTPFGRAISLKNQSIDIIQRYAPEAVFSATVRDTHKGDVALLRVPTGQVRRIGEPAKPRWVVFPRFVAGSTARLTPRSKAQSMLELARNSFNYMVLGRTGFDGLSRVIDASDCYDFQYSHLDDAAAVFDELAAGSLIA